MPRNTPSQQYGRGSELLHNLSEAVENAQGKNPCKLCVALDALEAPVATGVRRAIAARRPDGKRAIGPKTLTRILNNDGIKVSQYQVERHLRESHNE